MLSLPVLCCCLCWAAIMQDCSYSFCMCTFVPVSSDVGAWPRSGPVLQFHLGSLFLRWHSNSGPDHGAPCNHILAQCSKLHQNQYEYHCTKAAAQHCRRYQCRYSHVLSALCAQCKCSHLHRVHNASVVWE